MEVLLKRKRKYKGQSKYDPEPYTIVELVGRQAVIQRGEEKKTRETSKIKKFNTSKPEEKVQETTNDDWEEDFGRRTIPAVAGGKSINGVLSGVQAEETVVEVLDQEEEEPDAVLVGEQLDDVEVEREQPPQEQQPPRRSRRNKTNRRETMFGTWDFD